MLAIAAAIIALAFSALLFERSGSLGVARAMLDETGRASARLMAKNLSDDDKERAARAAAISLFKGSASLFVRLGFCLSPVLVAYLALNLLDHPQGQALVETLTSWPFLVLALVLFIVPFALFRRA
ncbi:MAG: hypothetical protein KDJ19_04895 [Hyphomicrobiaceae bacterium]|nr:hypothetical protein [Hyphomicrobiaceae bacterium]MCC0025091.1 hypothetical protein [Hyphomicrobiaceae bacterium]